VKSVKFWRRMLRSLEIQARNVGVKRRVRPRKNIRDDHHRWMQSNVADRQHTR
jgi:hypothetical protein